MGLFGATHSSDTRARRDCPGGSAAPLVQVSDLAVRTVGIGLEPALPLDPAVAAVAGVDLGALADRLAPLLEAQERLEERMQEELERLSA
jgi:hypothetical protein